MGKLSCYAGILFQFSRLIWKKKGMSWRHSAIDLQPRMTDAQKDFSWITHIKNGEPPRKIFQKYRMQDSTIKNRDSCWHNWQCKVQILPESFLKKREKMWPCWSWIRLFIEEKECKEETTQNREAINSTCLKKLFPNDLSGYVVGILELSCFTEQKWWNEEEPFLVCFWFMSSLLLRCSPWHGILHANEKK